MLSRKAKRKPKRYSVVPWCTTLLNGPFAAEIRFQGAIMSVKKEANGRRSVQIEIEVPGTPEEVWQAIATGPGISSWLLPAEFEERDGKPVALKLNFGPGMEPRSEVTAWEPP